MGLLIIPMVYIAYLILKKIASWEYDYFHKPKPVKKIEPLFTDVLELDKSGPRFQRFLCRLRDSPTFNFVSDGSPEVEERSSSISHIFGSSDHAELAPRHVKAVAGRMHGGIDIVCAAALDFFEHLSVGGVDDGNSFARRRSDRRVGDVVELHGCDFARKREAPRVWVRSGSAPWWMNARNHRWAGRPRRLRCISPPASAKPTCWPPRF